MPHSTGQAPVKAAVAATVAAYTYTDGVQAYSAADSHAQPDGVCLDNGLLQLNFSANTGRLASVKNRQAGVTANLTLDIAAYLSGVLDLLPLPLSEALSAPFAPG